MIVYAFGKMKGSPFEAAFCEYQKRLGPKVSCFELHASTKEKEGDLLLSKLSADQRLILLDEQGKNLKSRELASFLEEQHNRSQKLVFAIGGHAGFSDAVKAKAALTFSFGAATWPHLLVRVMLLEQLYRAELLLKGHPYHRD